MQVDFQPPRKSQTSFVSLPLLGSPSQGSRPVGTISLEIYTLIGCPIYLAVEVSIFYPPSRIVGSLLTYSE